MDYRFLIKSKILKNRYQFILGHHQYRNMD